MIDCPHHEDDCTSEHRCTWCRLDGVYAENDALTAEVVALRAERDNVAAELGGYVAELRARVERLRRVAESAATACQEASRLGDTTGVTFPKPNLSWATIGVIEKAIEACRAAGDLDAPEPEERT